MKERRLKEVQPQRMVRDRVPGSARDKVLSLVEVDERLSIERICERTGLPRKRVLPILAGEGYLRDESDRHPVCKPVACDNLLAALTKAHPVELWSEGPDPEFAEIRRRRFFAEVAE